MCMCFSNYILKLIFVTLNCETPMMEKQAESLRAVDFFKKNGKMKTLFVLKQIKNLEFMPRSQENCELDFQRK